jgi:hypothetical protein
MSATYLVPVMGSTQVFAAPWAGDKPPGLYGMADVLGFGK